MPFMIFGLVAFVIWWVLAGYIFDDSDTAVVESATNQVNTELAKMNAEREFEANLLDEIKKLDPSALDVYYSQNEQGDTTISVAKELPDGQIQTTSVPAGEMAQWIKAAKEQGEKEDSKSADQGTGGSNGMLTGLMMGYLASQMLSSSSAASGAAASTYASRSAFTQSRNEAVGRYTRSVSPALSALNRSGSSFTGTTSRGSFSSSGARSGGYSSGG